jgi:hypothetical protein
MVGAYEEDMSLSEEPRYGEYDQIQRISCEYYRKGKNRPVLKGSSGNSYLLLRWYAI